MQYILCHFQILDYEQFWLNLTEANLNKKAEWKREYVFSELYETKTFDPETFANIFENLKTSESWFNKYFQANSVKKVDYACDSIENCKSFHLCAISEQDYTKFEHCIEDSISSTTAATSTMTSSSPSSSSTSSSNSSPTSTSAASFSLAKILLPVLLILLI